MRGSNLQFSEFHPLNWGLLRHTCLICLANHGRCQGKPPRNDMPWILSGYIEKTMGETVNGGLIVEMPQPGFRLQKIESNSTYV